MRTLDANTLKNLMLGGSFWVIKNREELNRINRFPVADADTGTNLSATLYAVFKKLREKEFSSAAQLLKDTAYEAFSNARGNSGLIMSQYLVGLSNYIRREWVEIKELAHSIKSAYTEVYSSLENPIEGTILTVMREVGEEAERINTLSFRNFLLRIISRARLALEKTKNILPVLKREGLVDSGAKGFVLFLEGMRLSLDKQIDYDTLDFNTEYFKWNSGEGFYCTIATIRTRLTHHEIANKIKDLGDSIIFSSFNELMKVHIHTPEPDRFKEILKEEGEIVSMTAEPIVERELKIRETGLLADSSLDIPIAIAEELGIEIVPLGVIFDGKILKDGEEISREVVAERIMKKEEISSSLPLPIDFIRSYSKLKRNHKRIISFHLSEKASGTYSLSRTIKEKLGISGYVIDTGNFSLGGGLKVLRAVELLDKGEKPDDVVKKLGKLQSNAFIFADDLSYGVKGGRVKPWKGVLQKYLKLGIILGFSPEKGGIYFRGAAPGGKMAMRLLKHMIKRELGREKLYDIGIAFTKEDSRINGMEKFIRENISTRKIIKSTTSPAIMVHAGPSAFGIFALEI